MGSPESADANILQVLRITEQRENLKNDIGKSIDDIRGSYIHEVADHSIDLCRLLEHALSDCSQSIAFLRTHDPDESGKRSILLFRVLIHSVLHGFACCMEAMDQVCRTILGRTQKKDSLVLHLVRFLKNTLDQLLHLIDKQAMRMAESDDQRLPKRRRLSGSGEEEFAVNRYLTTLLVSVLRRDWSHQGGQAEVLEGVTCEVIRYTGLLLKEVPVDETEPWDMQKELESRYLLQILTASVGAGRVLASSERNPQMLQNLRKKMQGHLMNVMIGGSREALRFPSPPEEEEVVLYPEIAKHRKYGPEWLAEMVNAVVGFETIEGYDATDEMLGIID